MQILLSASYVCWHSAVGQLLRESHTIALLAVLFLLWEEGHQGQSAGAVEAVVQLEIAPTAAVWDSTVLTQGQQGYQPYQQHQAQSEESKGHWLPYRRCGRGSWNKPKPHSATKPASLLTTQWYYLLFDIASSSFSHLQSLFFFFTTVFVIAVLNFMQSFREISIYSLRMSINSGFSILK